MPGRWSVEPTPPSRGKSQTVVPACMDACGSAAKPVRRTKACIYHHQLRSDWRDDECDTENFHFFISLSFFHFSISSFFFTFFHFFNFFIFFIFLIFFIFAFISFFIFAFGANPAPGNQTLTTPHDYDPGATPPTLERTRHLPANTFQEVASQHGLPPPAPSLLLLVVGILAVDLHHTCIQELRDTRWFAAPRTNKIARLQTSVR